MHPKFRFAIALGLIACAAGLSVARAQNAGSQGSPAVTFQTEVDYVDVDVVVTDEQGNFVRDLTRDDFELLEDGKPVKVDTFSIVEIPVERQDHPAFGGRPIVEDVRSNRSTLAGRFYVIVLDDMGTSPPRSQYVIKAARQFVQQHFAANDTAAVVYTSGRRERAQEFTSDRALLLTSIDKFMGTKLRSSTLDKLDGYYMQKALAEGLAAQNNGEPVDPSSSQARDANPFSRGEGYPNRSYDMNDMERGQRALGVLGQIKNYAEFLANVRGRRKAMVLFSEGIDYPTNDIFAAHEATTVLGAMRDAVAAAARANVNIFTVDPRGLVGLTSEYIELNQSNADLFNIGARDPRYGMQPQTALLAEMRLTQDSLRTLSEETGGLASIDTNSFSTAFNRIVQANSLYYMLGYYPPNHPRDGKFHKIEVRVTRPGLRVEARRGYASPRGRTPEERKRDEAARLAREARRPDGKRTSTPLIGALTSPIPQSGLTFSVHAAPFKHTNDEASIAVAIEIDGSRLPYGAPDAKGLVANKIELSFFGLNDRGKAMSAAWSELDLNLRPETRDRVTAHGVRANPRISLPPGRYQIRIGARETVGGQTGSVFYDLDVPDFRKEKLMLSGLLMTTPSVQQTPSIQPDPVVSKLLPAPATSRREFPQSDVLALYTEIYDNDTSSQPRHIDVSLRVVSENGTEVLVSRDELVNGTSGEKPWDIYGFAKRIPLKGLAPGRYVLRMEAAVRGKDGATAMREAPITIRP